jgi:hypothetical protein
MKNLFLVMIGAAAGAAPRYEAGRIGLWPAKAAA